MGKALCSPTLLSGGLVKGYSASFYTSPRRGRLVHISPYKNKSQASVRKAKEGSLKVKGGQLFNIIPQELRDKTVGSVDQFKFSLDSWLASIPDQPTIPGRQRPASSNSLLDQVPLSTGPSSTCSEFLVIYMT